MTRYQIFSKSFRSQGCTILLSITRCPKKTYSLLDSHLCFNHCLGQSTGCNNQQCIWDVFIENVTHYNIIYNDEYISHRIAFITSFNILTSLELARYDSICGQRLAREYQRLDSRLLNAILSHRNPKRLSLQCRRNRGISGKFVLNLLINKHGRTIVKGLPYLRLLKLHLVEVAL